MQPKSVQPVPHPLHRVLARAPLPRRTSTQEAVSKSRDRARATTLASILTRVLTAGAALPPRRRVPPWYLVSPGVPLVVNSQRTLHPVGSARIARPPSVRLQRQPRAAIILPRQGWGMSRTPTMTSRKASKYAKTSSGARRACLTRTYRSGRPRLRGRSLAASHLAGTQDSAPSRRPSPFDHFSVTWSARSRQQNRLPSRLLRPSSSLGSRFGRRTFRLAEARRRQISKPKEVGCNAWVRGLGGCTSMHAISLSTNHHS